MLLMVLSFVGIAYISTVNPYVLFFEHRFYAGLFLPCPSIMTNRDILPKFHASVFAPHKPGLCETDLEPTQQKVGYICPERVTLAIFESASLNMCIKFSDEEYKCQNTSTH